MRPERVEPAQERGAEHVHPRAVIEQVSRDLGLFRPGWE
jgi:hypothetical protein